MEAFYRMRSFKRGGNRHQITAKVEIYLFPNSHAGYYPGAKSIELKVIFRKSDGCLLGAQALGEDGPAVDKRISVLAMAIQMGATIYDLEEAELCYAPQFGNAKDPVNFAGMVAADVLRGDMPLSHWNTAETGFLLDVREPVELAVEPCRARLTSRWVNSARASCKTGSKPETSPEVCCHVRSSWRIDIKE